MPARSPSAWPPWPAVNPFFSANDRQRWQPAAGSGIGRSCAFNPDLAEPNAAVEPAPVFAWRAALRSSDALFIASPEYGHSLSGVLKNASDWVIATGELNRKPVAITAAVSSPERGRRGSAELRQTLLAVDAALVGGDPVITTRDFEVQVAALIVELDTCARVVEISHRG